MVTEPEGQEQSQEEAAAPAEAAEPPTISSEPATAAESPPEPAAEAPRTGAETPTADAAQEQPAPRPPRPPRPADGGRGRRRGRFGFRRKVCSFCVEHVDVIDYKDVGRLRRFLSDRGRIEPKRKLGTCAKHQRRLSVALKRARHLALLPYTAEHSRQSGVASGRR